MRETLPFYWLISRRFHLHCGLPKEPRHRHSKCWSQLKKPTESVDWHFFFCEMMSRDVLLPLKSKHGENFTSHLPSSPPCRCVLLLSLEVIKRWDLYYCFLSLFGAFDIDFQMYPLRVFYHSHFSPNLAPKISQLFWHFTELLTRDIWLNFWCSLRNFKKLSTWNNFKFLGTKLKVS